MNTRDDGVEDVTDDVNDNDVDGDNTQPGDHVEMG